MTAGPDIEHEGPENPVRGGPSGATPLDDDAAAPVTLDRLPAERPA